MKSLLAGIALLVLLGFAGFFYRNMLEHRYAAPTIPGTACTAEAKLCPDGTSVGRTGPSCAFAPCPPPNVSLDSIGIAFAIPAGYAAAPQADDPALVAAYARTGTSTDTILIRDYEVPTGSTTDEVILANARLEPSDKPPASMSAFTPKIIGTPAKTYAEITTERFEGVITTDYFLPRTGDVLDFEITEHGVVDWTDPSLIPDNLPQHRALIEMLGTIETAGASSP